MLPSAAGLCVGFVFNDLDLLDMNKGTINQSERLDDLRLEVSGCQKCTLCGGRTNIVFGSGNPSSDVMIIGEAPGKNEDLTGEPFVGAAGKYLDELLGYANLKRQDVFIANVLKCRPPSNRDPKPEEIQVCAPFLREQVRIIDPKILITLGNFSTRFILKTEQGITRLRGQVYRTGKFLVCPVFHPAAALRDPKKKEILKEDFQGIGKLYGGLPDE